LDRIFEPLTERLFDGLADNARPMAP